MKNASMLGHFAPQSDFGGPMPRPKHLKFNRDEASRR